jgi:hypothetical protein
MAALVKWMLVTVIALGLFAPADRFDQSFSSPLNADTILEVMATRITTVSQDKYVYLRVLSGGTAECQPSSGFEDTTRTEAPLIKKPLTQAEFIRIKSVLSERKLATVGPRYETRYANVDSWTEWAIKIQRASQQQLIQIVGFSPGLAKTMKHPYPIALVNLGCNIEGLRAEVLGEPHSIHSECERILGTTR